MRNNFLVRTYQEQDWDSVLLLFKRINVQHGNVIFWWPGPKDTWRNIICVLQSDKLIAKGQVQILKSISSDYKDNANHLIYMNIKVDQMGRM